MTAQKRAVPSVGDAHPCPTLIFDGGVPLLDHARVEHIGTPPRSWYEDGPAMLGPRRAPRWEVGLYDVVTKRSKKFLTYASGALEARKRVARVIGHDVEATWAKRVGFYDYATNTITEAA